MVLEDSECHPLVASSRNQKSDHFIMKGDQYARITQLHAADVVIFTWLVGRLLKTGGI
jgi:hypothetical protein